MTNIKTYKNVLRHCPLSLVDLVAEKSQRSKIYMEVIRLNNTLNLLMFLDPLQSPIKEIRNDSIEELYRYSIKNRMVMPFLEKSSLEKPEKFEQLCKNERTKYRITLDAVGRVSELLTDSHIKHAVFKTIRPYRSTTVDIDTIIFGNVMQYYKAMKVMKQALYPTLGEGPMTTTFQDFEAKIGIDLYKDIAVSAICYLDKEQLAHSVIDKALPNGMNMKTLTPEADLSAIIAHSIVKEQMYTLSEYYTFIYYLKQMNIHDFLLTVKQNNITHAVKAHATITAVLYKQTHKTIPNELQEIVNQLGIDALEENLLKKSDYETPHKYHILTLARSLLEITKGKKCRSTIPIQIMSMLNPDFTKKFLKELIGHIIRETY